MKLENILYSKLNIYKAIYCLDSGIFEERLLSKEDKQLLWKLKNKFNFNLIDDVIEDVRKKMDSILKNDELFEVEVYFKPKKYKSVNNREYRPIHSSTLINQITMITMLNILLFDYKTDEKQIINYTTSSLSKLIPNNFYGNIPSEEEHEIFKPWKTMYTKYMYDANETFSKAYKDNEFSYEICLDLKNFFPSIDPYIIYYLIIDKLKIIYIGEDFEFLKKIVYKLLNFKITNFEYPYEYYYGKNIAHTKDKLLYSKGIAQGLPQSYYFGNLCMVKIHKIFDNIFPGKSFYYVDDSYIYTSSLKENDEEQDFKNRLKEVNAKIDSVTKEIIKSKENVYINLNNKVHDFQSNLEYNIEVHESGGKSQLSYIKDPINLSTSYLNSLTRQASMGGFDLKHVFSDVEDDILSNKFIALQDAIKKELSEIEDSINSKKYDKVKKQILETKQKKLIRYYKFFKYRLKVLSYRTDGDYTEVTKFFTESLGIEKKRVNIEDLKKYIELCKDDIFFISLYLLLDNRLFFSLEKIEKILKKIDKIDIKLFENINQTCSYVKRIIDQSVIERIGTENSYDSINDIVINKFGRYTGIHTGKRKDKLKDLLSNYKEKDNLVPIVLEEKYNYLNLLCNKSSDFERKILNALISNIFNVSADDNLNIRKNDRKLIQCCEFRILALIRNNNFTLKYNYNLLKDIIDKFDDTIIETSIIEVIDIFKNYVNDPIYIDNLILIHKYTSDMWRNGSKYLYFYTLHNQEHAVDLIKNSVHILKSVDFLQISKYDYYLVFISCYLHDISMVKYPDLHSFTMDDNEESNLLYYEFIKKKNLSKKDIIDLYRRIDNYFEGFVRNTHAGDSADIIRKTNDLNFLENSVRENIAQISEAHGYDSRDVYKVKSTGKNQMLNYKFNKIILRFADLFDISSYRISIPILNNNIKNMSEISAFHWLSHYYIKGYDVVTSYTNNSEENFLKPKNITEDINIIIYLKANKQLTSEESFNCKYNCINRIENDEIIIDFEEKQCGDSKCNFICKWMAKKNEYLYNELAELQSYLNRNNENFFYTKIHVTIKMLEELNLDPEHIKMIRKIIN
jgi:hypothetical protein